MIVGFVGNIGMIGILTTLLLFVTGSVNAQTNETIFYYKSCRVFCDKGRRLICRKRIHFCVEPGGRNHTPDEKCGCCQIYSGPTCAPAPEMTPSPVTNFFPSWTYLFPPMDFIPAPSIDVLPPMEFKPIGLKPLAKPNGLQPVAKPIGFNPVASPSIVLLPAALEPIGLIPVAKPIGSNPVTKPSIVRPPIEFKPIGPTPVAKPLIAIPPKRPIAIRPVLLE